jgi:ribonucleoside-diphosphate reductase alpha chain
MMGTSLPTEYQQFVHLSRYARWTEEMGRRETWEETVDRYLNFMCDIQCAGKIPDSVKQELRSGILGLGVMPSMRALMTAGPALQQNNIAGFNCSALIINHPHAFDEMLFVLMNGAGVGFSVERQFICELPTVAEKMRHSNTTIIVEDSKEGWAVGLREMIAHLYAGVIPKWDLSKIRPAGARLKTFGGRASGPEPLNGLFKFCVDLFKDASGRKLNSLECHDLCCKIADVVVVGGVRRAACISLSNLSDDRMRHAKSGEWWVTAPFRRLANNSSAYTEKPEIGAFMREWVSIYDSKSGERGIVNRPALKRQVKRTGRRDTEHEFIVNPCSEIILRSNQFCNLSEVVVRSDDTEESLAVKLRLATILGTMQATLTDFKYVRDIWKKNTAEESLIGVSLTGICDNPLTYGAKGKRPLAEMLERLRALVVATNKEWAAVLGIKQATACTTVKPSGTVSALVDCASGIHRRYSKLYVRRVRADKKDPLAKMMSAAGFPEEDDVMAPAHTSIFSFPMKSPEGCETNADASAIEQLELWKVYHEHWTEHQPSITVHVKENEWLEVGAWVYRHFEIVSGIAFQPLVGHTYRQTPYEEIDEAGYAELLARMPKNVDWSALKEFEKEDCTLDQRVTACSGDSCELVDLVR